MTEDPLEIGFFATGGTLALDVPSYVERQADADLLRCLLAGEFCYVLTSRQMGKSSLMVRTAARLRDRKIGVAVLDLSRIGNLLTDEQWYYSLAAQAAQRFGMQKELRAFWQECDAPSPLQKWIALVEHCLLQRPDTRLVIFMDEIDQVRALHFSTDEFFGAIRACYNRRAEDPHFARLAFCLLGVASPSDLIQDTRLTPFNIGRRIALTDFTPEEAAPLALGLMSRKDAKAQRHKGDAGESIHRLHRGTSLTRGEYDTLSPLGRLFCAICGWNLFFLRLLRFFAALFSRFFAAHLPLRVFAPLRETFSAAGSAHRLLARILYWTGGHPYLTQRLCQAVAAAKPGLTPDGVDSLCADLFLTSAARNQQTNLLFVKDRVLKSDPDAAGALNLYRRVIQGKPVLDVETDAHVSVLRLSGVVRAENGLLRVRNRIYARVFDRAWIAENMPQAELRRQRKAYWQGVGRAALAAVVLIALFGSLSFLAYREHINTQKQQALTKQAQNFNYAADMYVLQNEWNNRHDGRALEILNNQRPQPGENDMRGWEWCYLWQQAHGNKTTYRAGKAIVFSVAYSRDGSLLATASGDNLVRLWNPRTHTLIDTLHGHTANVLSVAFSLGGRLLASCGDDNTLRLWDTRTHQQVGEPMTGRFCAAFSPDGRTIASSAEDARHSVRLWDVATRRQKAPLPYKDAVYSLAYSPDGKFLAAGGAEKLNGKRVVRLWDTGSWRSRPLIGHQDAIYTIAFSPDGRHLATGSHDGTVILWELPSGRLLHTLKGHSQLVNSVAFSPDGKTLASGSWDLTTKLWNVATGKEIRTLRGQPDLVTCVAFSPDGKSLATASRPEMRIWDLARPPEDPKALFLPAEITHMALSPDSRMLAVLSNEKRRFRWLPFSVGQPQPSLPAPELDPRTASFFYTAIAFSKDRNWFAAASESNAQLFKVALWSLSARKKAADLPSASDIIALAFSPDARWLAVANTPGDDVTIWDMRTQQKRANWKAGGNPIHSMVFSPDGRQMITAGWDRTLRVWQMTDGKPSPQPVRVVTGYPSNITSIALSPDGKTLAIAGGTRTISLWQVATFREMITLQARQNIRSVTFTQDGKTLIGAGGETKGLIEMWQAPNMKEVEARQ